MAVASYYLEEITTEIPSSTVHERPYFGPRQIRNLDQIFKGQKLRICGGESDTFAVVTQGPYRECGKLKIDLAFRKSGQLWKRTILLESHSVVRYEDKSWNPTNWLEKA